MLYLFHVNFFPCFKSVFVFLMFGLPFNFKAFLTSKKKISFSKLPFLLESDSIFVYDLMFWYVAMFEFEPLVMPAVDACICSLSLDADFQRWTIKCQICVWGEAGAI